MIGYTTLGTNDFARSTKFYDELLAALGARRVWEDSRMVMWGTGPSGLLALVKPVDGQPAERGNGVMVALTARSPEHVTELYQKALALGAPDEGAPGPREGGFFAGYFRDPDGNKLCFFCLLTKSAA